METSSITATADNRFSWSRVAEFAAYFRPIYSRQVVFYFGVSVLCAILTLLPFGRYVQVGLFTLIWSIIPLLFNLAPIMLAKAGDTRIVDRMIPVRASEKFVFYILYFYIIIGLSTYAIPFFANWLYLRIPAIQTDSMVDLINLQFGTPGALRILNILAALCTTTTCLYAVLSARTGRIVKGVLAALAVQFGIGILGIFIGGATAFSQGVSDGLKQSAYDKELALGDSASFGQGLDAGFMEGYEFSKDVITYILDNWQILCIGIVIEAAYLIFMLRLIYRQIKKSNL